MLDRYTFFIISNINSKHSHFSNDQRFLQTLETISSIRLLAPGATILFSDNSTTPLDGQQVAILKSMVDRYVEYQNNLFTRHINTVGKNKGLNEMLVYERMLDAALQEDLVGRRIFKISGRYTLAPTFDIHEYSKPQYVGKYVFRQTPWIYNEGQGEYVKWFYNTALWSLCGTLVPSYKQLMDKMFRWMLVNDENIEMAHNNFIPKENLTLVNRVHGCGWITNGEWTQF